jgi:hypothetical protein
MFAFESGNKEIIELLLNNHANLNAINRDGDSAIDKCHPFLRQDTPWLQMIHDIYSGAGDYIPSRKMQNSGFGLVQVGETDENQYTD